MGDREVYLEDENVCDICGKSPAYDFYGDFICQECMKKEAEKEAEKAVWGYFEKGVKQEK